MVGGEEYVLDMYVGMYILCLIAYYTIIQSYSNSYIYIYSVITIT